MMNESPTHSPREVFLRIHSDHRFLKRWAQFVVAYANKSRRGVPRSGGLGGEAPPYLKNLFQTSSNIFYLLFFVLRVLVWGLEIV